MEHPANNQVLKAHRFKFLHERPGCFVIPNAWNGGTAKILDDMGFEAIATTSAGLAFSLGRPDGSGRISLEENLANAKEIVHAAALPVSCDLENGYSHTAAGIAQTIASAAKAGVTGGSIEDATGIAGSPIFDLKQAAERVQVAVEAARKFHFPFLITARAENFLYGKNDLKDTIRRLQHFQDAGADVLFAPGLTRREDIRSVIKEVDRPLNVIMGLGGADISLEELSAMGVKRVSVGSALCRAAFGAFIEAAKEINAHGSFNFGEKAVSYKELNTIFSVYKYN
jgi:2-methylisocitrate lyase-like PEP mutase family enzyme